MKPIVTAEVMRAADAQSQCSEAELVRRAAWQVARVAQLMLGGCYGRRIVVVAGPGNNGNDGRVAADILRSRGGGVEVISPGTRDRIDNCDLIIDAAYGISFHGEYMAPIADAKVLAVDIPSGVESDTGHACAGAVVADKTVTFAAFKPAHYLHDGPLHCGDIELVDIGIEVNDTSTRLFDSEDAQAALPSRRRDAHKWNAALTVVAGSQSMMGAAKLVALGAMRSGSGMVHLITPSSQPLRIDASEVIHRLATDDTLVHKVLNDCERAGALVIGPGLGRGEQREASIREIAAKANVPVVIDGDALFAFRNVAKWGSILSQRSFPTILTPHAGEFARFNIDGEIFHKDGDMLSAVRKLASLTQCVVVLKGPTTLVADQTQQVLFVNEGDARLATAGTGDVLAGMLGSFLAQRVEPTRAAALAAWVHGHAARHGRVRGFMAGDLPALVADTLSGMEIAHNEVPL